MTHHSLLPRQPVPSLRVSLVGGGDFVLGGTQPEQFDLLVFYRGLHCPLCAKYLLELSRLKDDFAQRGVSVLALSSDNLERAATMAQKAPGLQVGYGLTLTSARQWGLYISAGRGKTSINIEEPPLFSEPGVFLVRPCGTLYYAAVQSMPFARPGFGDLLGAVDFAIAKDYPARGEYVGELPA